MHKLFVDGASRGNPGPASVGASLCLDDQEVDSVSETIGIATNNVAEYKALIMGLTCAIQNNVSEIQVFADSELMVRQVMGQYKVKNENLKSLFIEIKNLMSKFRSFSIAHVPREQNARADELANLALDA
ncbi:MAG: ribonuclease HI family protein [Bdellovibrionales bacterium]|nr:ribonuclease HI family protein [Bdellovibrionales bacterium]